MRPRSDARRRGLSAIEVTVGAGIAAGLLLTAGTILKGTTGMAESTSNVGVASTRVQSCLGKASDILRRASLATVQSADGSPFSDGETASWIRMRPVTGFSGTVTLGEPGILRFDRATGAASGNVVYDDGVTPLIIAREVTAFSITRTGNLFTISCAARSGPRDDRLRVADGAIVTTTRNP